MAECRAYCLRSIFLFRYKSNLVQVELSITLAILHVREMGFKSLSRSFVGYRSFVFGIAECDNSAF